ncbi:hypothetical protein [uncultured Bradyrhizobium sp.]|uniref:hypothetical protein n=1 Tax=uncultured Bradyrhizobium sp. TaxID=199684 RepID=UPI0035CB7E78
MPPGAAARTEDAFIVQLECNLFGRFAAHVIQEDALDDCGFIQIDGTIAGNSFTANVVLYYAIVPVGFAAGALA